MKIKELLLELQEILNRSASYGAWVNSKTKEVYPVKKFGHTHFVKEFGVSNKNQSKTEMDQIPYKQLYQVGFAWNLVRITHDPREQLAIDGVASDISKITRIIMATAIQRDIEMVIVDKRNNPGSNNLGARTFSMPMDRNALRAYIS